MHKQRFERENSMSNCGNDLRVSARKMLCLPEDQASEVTLPSHWQSVRIDTDLRDCVAILVEPPHELTRFPQNAHGWLAKDGPVPDEALRHCLTVRLPMKGATAYPTHNPGCAGTAGGGLSGCLHGRGFRPKITTGRSAPVHEAGFIERRACASTALRVSTRTRT